MMEQQEEHGNQMETDVTIPDDKIQEMREAFTLFDKNKDGTIDPEELADVLRSLNMNPTEADIKDMINDIDLNKNGMVDFNEFLNMMKKHREEKDATTELMEAFRIFDTDGNGYISSEELKHAMVNLGEKLTDADFEHMIKHADIDQDGRLNYEEFVNAMTEL